MATILGRMKFHNIDINRLSPLGYASVSRKYDEVRIAGRNVFDYYGAYKKYKHKTLPSYKLEDISYDECDIPRSDYPMEKMNTQYSSDITDYNLIDVYRMQALEFKLAIIPFYDNLRQTVGCTFKETFEASKYVDIMLLRYTKGKFVLPRKKGGEPRLDYIGAVVLPPEKGLHENVIMLDFTKHYPIILISYNISPETLRLTEPDEPHYTLSIGLKHKDEFGDPYTTWQDVYYLKEPVGLLPSVARDLIALRDEVRDKMVKYQRDSEEYKLLWFRQDALKVVLDAMYGVFAYPNFRLFIPQLSASMTGQGQKLILRTIDFVEKKGYKALYGDTDSVYFAVGDSPIEKGEKLRDDVNEFWQHEKDTYGLYAAPNVKLEYVFESLLLARKKRYSAMVIYDNGDKARSLKIVGFAARRSDSALISQALQQTIFKQIHAEKAPTSNIVQTIKDVAAEVPTKPLQDICIPLPLKTSIDQMKNRARVKSIIYANKYLDQHIGTGTHSLEIYIKTEHLKGEAKKEYGFRDKPILPWHLPSKFSFSTWSPKAQHYVQKEYTADRIAFGRVPGEEWRRYIDMAAMVERVIWNKVDIILNALGVSIEDRVEIYGSKRPIKKDNVD